MASNNNQKKKDKKKQSDILSPGLFGEKINTVPYGIPTKHKSPLLPDGHIACQICGLSGSGKSTLLCEIIPNLSNISHIIICSRIVECPLYDAIREYCETRDEPIKYAIANDPITAKTEIQAFVQDKPKETGGVIIFDDFSDMKPSKADPYNNCVNLVSAMLRNYGFHNFFITQSPINVQTLYRTNACIKILFKINQVHAIRSICDDFTCSGLLNKQEFMGLFNVINRVEHSFLMLISRGSVDKDKLYIYLPSEASGNKNEPITSQLKEVEIIRSPKIDEDTTIRQLAEIIHSNSVNTPFERLQKRKANKQLKTYIDYLISQYGGDPDTIYDEIERVYHITL